MSTGLSAAAAPGFLRTVGVLLGASWKRAAGRRKRQRELLRQRTRKTALDWSWLGFAAAVAVMALVNGGTAFVVAGAVSAGERAQAELRGKIVVHAWFLRLLRTSAKEHAGPMEPGDLDQYYRTESWYIARENGGSAPAIANQLRASVQRHGTRDLIAEKVAAPGLAALPRAGPLAALLGSIVLLWWCVMVVFQGEGLELDLQRRRHPMWEWLFSHPVPAGAVFMAELLSPIAANPIYCTVPLFPGLLYSFIYGPQLGVVAGLVIGLPLTVATACLGKALEIAVILRFPPRSRGAMIGLMSWIGYASMMLFILGALSVSKMAVPAGKFLQPLTAVPWPYLGLFLGQINGSFSYSLGLATCVGAAGVTTAVSVWFCIWGARQGLSGNFGRADAGPAAVKYQGIRFGRRPLYRKEILWFSRDRSAIVQTILVPLTVAGFQVFNLRGLANQAQGAWNYLCGAAILFGTYFLWILGPKSLGSEGTALWIALTWPQGLEALLKAKAWLWSLISTVIVALVLLYAAFLYPADGWKILLVGISWIFFGRSMAEKTVTLVRVPSESGEPAKISRTRQWAASLGMLTFAMGVFTQHWHIAIMGIVYSYMTAAAMWENFRARLPFLYDPWSEKLPPPPTLMHAMIAISLLVEGGAVLTGGAMAILGRENIATAQAVIYGTCAVVVSLGLAKFLSDRGVRLRDVWCWRQAGGGAPPARRWWCGDGTHGRAFFLALLLGVGGGVLLGLFARAYLAVLLEFPDTAAIIHHAQEQMAKIPGLRISYMVMAVVFAPFAEEYLFRGLLFRALDREWGGWRAIIGSAAFFAIYHPVLSWLPVSLLGIANALLFKRTGRLAPAVVLHLVYNSVVFLG
jgi:membrane protease YdiL (CAAX protease family)